ncbi:amino acid ABC transporter permease [Oricola thermophila]|uniref:Putative glutamine transport system permease protein GlnP n=1 Tax=Oricola thermophila TaxID=2742145 RepID=A0A6N1VEL7_9HYPH|nr:amino acid ABC transporter permease [Oricola thermophila]QKV18963.1 amino acid ABC transporter permease [Oricola thermophila]
MLYQDTVVQGPLVRNPLFLTGVVAVLTVLFGVIDLTGTIFGDLLRPAIGEPTQSGMTGRLAVAFALSICLGINIVLVSFLAFRVQMFVVWMELLGLFLAFFYGFNLDFAFIRSKIWFMVAQGVLTTIYISGISIVLASALALIGAIAKLSANGFAFAIASFYTSFFRGLPLLMQVYLIYLGMPQLGYVIDAVPAGILALTLCYGAYMTEIFRAGIQSIDKGQWEASRSLGMKFGRTMRSIILPQALPLIIPPTGNQFISMLKDSSLVSVIGVWELMFLARTLGAKDFKHMEMLITAALIYWVLSIVLELIQSRIERHYRRASH